jgi:hypothetical protein
VFASLAVDEMQKGNTSNGTMSRIGYDNIRELYEQQTGLRHDRRCVKNKYAQLKTLYTFYKWACTQTGVGRKANGGLDAPTAWWQRHTKVIFVLIFVLV